MTDDVQNEPVEDGSGHAPDEQKIAGIVAQVRADAALGSGDAIDLLRIRLDDAEISVTDDEFDRLAQQVTPPNP